MIGFAVFSSFNRFTTIFVCVLLCVVYLLSYASGEYDGRDSSSGSNNDRAPSNEFGSCTDGKCIKRTSQDITSGMWFGPRLGRRRRADRKPEINSDIEAFANAFEEPHWAIVTIPETEKRQITQFTPRLGRESGEDYFSYGFPKDQEELYTEEQIYLPLFASRLGRRVPWTPSPRLGRQLHNIVDKLVSAACVSKLYGYDRSLCRHMAHGSSGRRVTRVVTLFPLTPSMFPCHGKEFNPISLHL